jgi:protein SCO1/2
MTQPARKIEWLVWAGLLLIVLTLGLLSVLAVIKLRGAKQQPLPVYGQVADFSLTNQFGGITSVAKLRGHVWIGDIIFSRCPGPCLKMTKAMKSLQDALPQSSRAKLVTVTTDPEYDTPLVLKNYGERFGADTNRWLFLTGTKQQIARVARESLKLSAVEKAASERQSADDLFIHSTVFVVVDKSAQLRGIFETTGDDIDPERVKTQILTAVERLEREP